MHFDKVIHLTLSGHVYTPVYSTTETVSNYQSGCGILGRAAGVLATDTVPVGTAIRTGRPELCNLAVRDARACAGSGQAVHMHLSAMQIVLVGRRSVGSRDR